MTSLSHSAGESGAECAISGTHAINATWSEDLYFYDPDGSPMVLTGLRFDLQFRSSAESDDADVTLSTTNSKLTITADSGAVNSILRISAAAGTFEGYEGEMIADLVGIDQSNNVTLYGHGVVNFTNSPVAI